jgi:hypothetical protein
LPARAVGQQQNAIIDDLQLDARIDEASQAFRAFAPEYVGHALRVGSQDLDAALLDGHLPCIPEGGCK